jgi:hypothetical protein
MAGLEEELDQLRRERDQRIHDDFSALSKSIEKLTEQISKLASAEDVKSIDKRVGILESYKWMVIGGAVVIGILQAAQAFMQWFVRIPR